jgi:hypothetical protein
VTPLQAAPTTVPSSSNGGSNSWIWLLVALVVVGIVIALLVANRRRHERAAWGNKTERAVADGKLIVDQFRSGVAERGDAEPVLKRQLEVFDATLAGIEQSAPSNRRPQVIDARRAVGNLGAAIDSDLQLRIGPPAPTTEQLNTSHAVMDQAVLDLDAALDGLAQTAASST